MKTVFVLPILGESVNYLYGIMLKRLGGVALIFENEESVQPEHLNIVRRLLCSEGEFLLSLVGDDALELLPFEPCLN